MEIYTLIASGGLTLSFFVLYIYRKEKERSRLFFYYAILSFVLFLIVFMSSAKLYKKEIITFLSSIKQEERIEKGKEGVKSVNKIQIEKVSTEKRIDVPLFSQLPELPRGAAVTSLSMLLQFEGINVEKMELSKKVKKDTTPMTFQHGKIHFGNPNIGFVGDMYSYRQPGYGVYNKPIQELAEIYLPRKVVNLTGSDFTKIINSLNHEKPVWIITNRTYKQLDATQFDTWETPKGDIEVTYKEHSVVTGYDESYIYFNDPLTFQKDQRAVKSDFIAAWEQMGKQAITVCSQYVNNRCQ